MGHVTPQTLYWVNLASGVVSLGISAALVVLSILFFADKPATASPSLGVAVTAIAVVTAVIGVLEIVVTRRRRRA